MFLPLSAASSLRRRPVSGRFSRWLIFYRVTPNRIEIARIVRGERNWQALL